MTNDTTTTTDESPAHQHPDPLGDKDHWVIEDEYPHTFHAPGTSATSPCGFRGGEVKHHKHITGAREDFDICAECQALVEG